jgi:hypothetical protein
MMVNIGRNISEGYHRQLFYDNIIFGRVLCKMFCITENMLLCQIVSADCQEMCL